jgi:Zn-finger in ubiquitin-hydrolases and other protein
MALTRSRWIESKSEGSKMRSEREGINSAAEAIGTGCAECLALGGWWWHLRKCGECGHIGCCDSSPSQHARKHCVATGHPIITSFEPGERWSYDYRTEEFFTGPRLRAPHSHPLDQPVPGPIGAVPSIWQSLLHEEGALRRAASDAGRVSAS